MEGRSEVVGFFLLTVHEFTEAVTKYGHVSRRRLEIEVEAVNHSVSEGPVLAFSAAGPEGLPDGVCTVYGVGLRGSRLLYKSRRQ